MASQNEIVWKKDLTDIQSGLETLATKTKISVDLSSMNYDKVKKINVVALETAVNKLEEAFSGNCCQANCCQTLSGVSILPDLPRLPKVSDLSRMPNVPRVSEVSVLHDQKLQLRLQLRLLR